MKLLTANFILQLCPAYVNRTAHCAVLHQRAGRAKGLDRTFKAGEIFLARYAATLSLYFHSLSSLIGCHILTGQELDKASKDKHHWIHPGAPLSVFGPSKTLLRYSKNCPSYWSDFRWVLGMAVPEALGEHHR